MPRSLLVNHIFLEAGEGGLVSIVLPQLVGPILFIILSLALGQPECRANPIQPSKTASALLSEERKKLEVYDFKEKGLLEELASLEMKVLRKRKEIRAIGKELKELKEAISRLRKRYEKLNAEADKVEARLAERLVVIYKYARRGYLRFLASAKDLDEFRRRVTYLGYLMKSDRKALEALHEQRIRLERELALLKSELARAEKEVVEKSQRLSSLKGEMESQVIRLMKIHKEKEFYETAVKELGGGSEELKYAVVKAVKRAAPERPVEWGKFSAQKGRLPLPCKGKVIRGSRFFRSKKNHLYKGIFIRTEKDAEVKAIFPGRVEFSGRLKGYGQVIIINHGEKFFTISGLLAERKKEEGDVVRAGEIIGRIKKQGSPLGASLYFEIRKGDKNLDPLKWLNLSDA